VLAHGLIVFTHVAATNVAREVPKGLLDDVGAGVAHEEHNPVENLVG
jgi:hypothetical protein